METGDFSSFPPDLGFSPINPRPILWVESDLMISDYLSEAKLKEISNSDDLRKVSILEIVVNTTDTSLGNFGQHLPNLIQLKLSNSLIPSVRDIGTSLRNLQVLWLSRCSLKDVDGIASLQSLKELYVSFNDISDASPISFLDALEVLDLEANKICDLEQIDYLCMMSELNTLTLAGNQVTQLSRDDYGGCSYREYVLAKLPGLTMLDDDLGSKTVSSSDASNKNDVDIITAAIKEGMILESDAPIVTKRDETNFNFSSDVLHSSFFETAAVKRPATSHRLQRPESSLASNYQDDSSSLTFGNPLSGNPINLLRNRRKAAAPREEDLLDPSLLMRPTTALGIPCEIDSLLDEEESGIVLNRDFFKPKHIAETPQHKHRVFDNCGNDDDDDVLFTQVRHSPQIMRPGSSKDFNPSHPPDFLKRLKPPLSPIKNPMRAPPPRTSKLKPFYQYDQTKIVKASHASVSSPQLPQLQPSPPVRRPKTSYTTSRNWQLKNGSLGAGTSKPMTRHRSAPSSSALTSQIFTAKEVSKKHSLSLKATDAQSLRR